MPKVSIFSNASADSLEKDEEIAVVLQSIKTGVYEQRTKGIFLNENKEERDRLKISIPAICFTGTFTRRDNSSLVEHSGFIAIDIDGVSHERAKQIRNDCRRNNYVYAAFLSVSGFGVRLVFRIDSTRFLDSFLGIEEVINAKYDVKVDRQSRVLSRSFCVSYDKELHVNERSLEWDHFVEKPSPKLDSSKKKRDYVGTDHDFKFVYDQIIAGRIQICRNHDEWNMICRALTNKFGEQGREYFHEISRLSPGYKDEKDCNAQYTAYLKREDGSGGKTSIASFFSHCKSFGIGTESAHTKFLRKKIISQRRSGIIKIDCIANLTNNHVYKGAEELVDDIYDNEIEVEKEDAEDKDFDFIKKFISEHCGSLIRNELTMQLEYEKTRIEFSSIDEASLLVSLGKQRYKAALSTILASNFFRLVNPIKDYFDHLKPYDTSIVDKFISCIRFKENQEIAAYFVKKWLVSIPAAAYGVPCELFLNLSGKPGSGKTWFFTYLLPAEMKKYFVNFRSRNARDDDESLCENLIRLHDECSEYIMSTKAQDLFKSTISLEWVSIRDIQGKKTVKRKRIAVLCGTSNPTSIIVDHTGNRRILSFEVQSMNWKLYDEINKEHLMAALKQLYEEGFECKVVGKEIEMLNEATENATLSSDAEDWIAKYFEPYDSPNSTYAKFVPVVVGEEVPEGLIWADTMGITNYLNKVNGLSGRNQLQKTDVLNALRRQGFMQKSIRASDEKVHNKVFLLKIRNYESDQQGTKWWF